MWKHFARVPGPIQDLLVLSIFEIWEKVDPPKLYSQTLNSGSSTSVLFLFAGHFVFQWIFQRLFHLFSQNNDCCERFGPDGEYSRRQIKFPQQQQIATVAGSRHACRARVRVCLVSTHRAACFQNGGRQVAAQRTFPFCDQRRALVVRRSCQTTGNAGRRQRK